MENITPITDFYEAATMIGDECLFALNSQMAPLKCVITGVDCTRGNILFTISLNLDPNVGEFQEDETWLSRVSPKFLFKPEVKG